jgi:hypothetical protein
MSEIASHGPAAIMGSVVKTISQGTPAQVDDRGRRRDRGSNFTTMA